MRYSPNRTFTFEDSFLPLIEVVQYDGHDEQDWRWVLGQYEELFKKRQRYTLLVDASRLTQTIQPKTRKIVTDWITSHMTLSKRWNVGAAVVMHSGLIRGAFTAMMWIVTPPVPLAFPANYDNALDWCVGRLEGSGLPVPLSVRTKQADIAKKRAL